MECPKCRHEIHLNLTPEELIYCPYCEQRMIPESDAALACESGEPLPQEKPAEDLEVSPTAGSISSSEEITPLAEEETSVSENLSTLPAEGVPSPLCEEPAVGEQPDELPVEPQMKEVPPQNIEEELTVIIEEFPEQSVPETAIQQPCEKLPVTDAQTDQDTLKEEDNVPTFSDEEAPLAEATPEPEAKPAQEDIPSCAAEMPPQEDEQPRDTSVPSLEYIDQAEDEEPQSVCQEPTETGSNSPTGNNVASEDFSFCFACGQKLLPDALFCSRCGKRTSPIQPPDVPIEPPQPVHTNPRKNAARPEKEESRVTAEPKQPHHAEVSAEPPSYAIREPAPCPGQYVQPEDSPFRLHDPVSIKLNSRTPAKKTLTGTGSSSSGAMPAVRDFFSRPYVRFSIVAVALVALFVLIGLAMSYCG